MTKDNSIVFAINATSNVAEEGENGPRLDMMRPYFGWTAATTRNKPDKTVE
jgi:hypothetical protein